MDRMTPPLASDRRTRAGIYVAMTFVAVPAAVVSFIHIQHLAITHGQTKLAAAMLPLSIDGTVVVSSLVMLEAARAKLPTPWLARTMLVLAVAGTLAANVAYGVPWGLVGGLTSGAYAAAFLGCIETAILRVRRHVATPETVATVVPEMAMPQPEEWPRPVAKRVAKRSNSGQREAAIAALVAEPNMTAEDLEKRYGGTGRTARRWRETARTMATSNGHH